MIRLHHCHGTRSTRVLWLLHELGLPFELTLWPFDRTLHGDAFGVLNPVGRVPVLEIEGAVMTESLAMMEYLCERHDPEGLGRTTGAPDRMDWLQWLHFAETVSQHVAALTQQHVALYEDHMRSAVVMKIEARRLEKCMAAIEARLSTPVETRDHLLTAGFSACDIAVGQAVDMARRFVRLPGEVAAWHGRLAARPAFRRAAPPDGMGLYDREFYPVPEPRHG